MAAAKQAPKEKSAKKAKRRHKGVVLRKPSSGSRIGWRAMFVDPDVFEREGVKRYKYESLPAELTTAEQREAWAVAKAAELAKRRVELALGAQPATGSKLSDVIGRFATAHPKLSDRTKEDYDALAAKLLEWAAENGIKAADKLDRKQLMRYREAIINAPKKVALKGKGVGRRRAPTAELRSSSRINSDLRKTGTILYYLVDACEFSRLSRDDVRRFAKPLEEVRERIVFLHPHEIQKSLEAALRHDADCFTETKAEHAGHGRKTIGTTPRYTPIAPFTVFCLLSGARLGEALGLQWSEVELEAVDTNGNVVGDIKLAAHRLKTKRYRDVDLSISPALRSLLAAMKLASGGKGRVFTLTEGEAESAAKRLKAEYGAPQEFGWQVCRRTCATFLTNSPGVFGSASAYRSAKQIGHAVPTAEKFYLGVLKGISPDAKTLEAAMQIEDLVAKMIGRVGTPRTLAGMANLTLNQK
jgi:integrase